jgi:rRNA maturation endonuclease Nob1
VAKLTVARRWPLCVPPAVVVLNVALLALAFDSLGGRGIGDAIPWVYKCTTCGAQLKRDDEETPPPICPRDDGPTTLLRTEPTDPTDLRA